MKRTQFTLIVILSAFLVACGGGGVTPTPTPTPTPVPGTPTTPPPTTAPPAGDGVLYYGEWGWQFEDSSDIPSNEEGRFSITETHQEEGFVGSFGYYQQCFAGNCYDSPDGGLIFGTLEGEGLVALLYTVNTSNDPVITYVATDQDGAITKDEQGRDQFKGGATYDSGFGDPASGTFTATLIGDAPVLFPTAQQHNMEKKIQKILPGFKAIR